MEEEINGKENICMYAGKEGMYEKKKKIMMIKNITIFRQM